MTVILVSHRLSTIKLADSIVLLKDGALVEKGTFIALIEKNGQFKSFVNAQLFDKQTNRSQLSFQE